MKPRMRKYQDENDSRRIRRFLQDVFLKNQRHEHSWPLYRWDYWRWHVNENLFHFNLEAAIFLWETQDGRLVGMLNPDRPGEAFLQMDPEFCTPELEVEMINVAETQYALSQPGGAQELTIWSPQAYTLRQDILQKRGYSRQPWPEYQRCCSMSLPVVECPPPAGYTIRELGGEDDLPARSWVSWKAFHPDEPDEKYQGWSWYCNVQRAPLYRQELDLVALTLGGEMAAFCTVWYDPYTQTAAFEPVGTHPAHQRRGLGKALMLEGLRRLQPLGATLAAVSSYSEEAGALYAAVGFSEYDLSEPWTKTW
jgi:mycothiol synthase